MAGEGDLERTELEAALEARRELGPTYDAALVDSFADRIERVVRERQAGLSGTERERRDLLKLEQAAGQRQMVLGFVSLGTGIPISAIAATNTEPGLVGLLVAWAGIVGVNVAHAVQSRRRS